MCPCDYPPVKTLDSKACCASLFGSLCPVVTCCWEIRMFHAILLQEDTREHVPGISWMWPLCAFFLCMDLNLYTFMVINCNRLWVLWVLLLYQDCGWSWGPWHNTITWWRSLQMDPQWLWVFCSTATDKHAKGHLCSQTQPRDNKASKVVITIECALILILLIGLPAGRCNLPRAVERSPLSTPHNHPQNDSTMGGNKWKETSPTWLNWKFKILLKEFTQLEYAKCTSWLLCLSDTGLELTLTSAEMCSCPANLLSSNEYYGPPDLWKWMWNFSLPQHS